MSTHTLAPVVVDAQLHWSEPLQSAHSRVQNVFPAEQVSVVQALTGSHVSPARQHWLNSFATHRSSAAGQLQELNGEPSQLQFPSWQTGVSSQQTSPQVCAAGHAQAPLTHVSGSTQAGVQVFGTTHCPFWQVPPLPHACPSGQLATHVPARQICPVPHAAPSGAIPLHFPLRRVRQGGHGFFFFLPFFFPSTASSLARARSVPPARLPPSRRTRRRRVAPSPSERTIESKVCSSKACPLIGSRRDVAPGQVTHEDRTATHPGHPAPHPAGHHEMQSGAARGGSQPPPVRGRPSRASSHDLPQGA
jgi:hypothetical protein